MSLTSDNARLKADSQTHSQSLCNDRLKSQNEVQKYLNHNSQLKNESDRLKESIQMNKILIDQ